MSDKEFDFSKAIRGTTKYVHNLYDTVISILDKHFSGDDASYWMVTVEVDKLIRLNEWNKLIDIKIDWIEYCKNNPDVKLTDSDVFRMFIEPRIQDLEDIIEENEKK